LLAKAIDNNYNVLVSAAKALTTRKRGNKIDRDICLELSRDRQRMQQSLLLILIGLRPSTRLVVAGVISDGVSY